MANFLSAKTSFLSEVGPPDNFRLILTDNVQSTGTREHLVKNYDQTQRILLGLEENLLYGTIKMYFSALENSVIWDKCFGGYLQLDNGQRVVSLQQTHFS